MNYRVPLNQPIRLTLSLQAANGTGATGKAPTVAIRRRLSASGGSLDGYYWNGATFVSTPTFLSMTEVDAAHLPGSYEYLFAQPGVEQSYQVYYTCADPVGFDEDSYVVTSQVAPATGAYQVSIIVEDQADAAVPGIVVDVRDAADSLLVVRAEDGDGNGAVALNLAPGTYKVRLSRFGFTPQNATETLVVAADTAVIYHGAVLPTPTAADPSLCTVWGYALDATGAPQSGVEVDFFGDAPLGVGSAVVTADKAAVITGPTPDHLTWPAGYFEVNLIRLSQVRTKATTPKLDGLVIAVPDAGSARLADLVGAAR